MNAYTVGGTIRTTFTMAAELAKRHDVEIVSVYRMRSSDPALPVPSNVRLRMLTDLRAPTLERLAAGRGPGARIRTWAVRQPSRLISSQDYRYDNFSVLTDVNLLRFLATVRDGVLIGTRPGLNLAIAHLIPDKVVKIGQDHVNLASYRRGLRAQIRAAYPRLDLVSTLTEGDAAAYRKLLKRRAPDRGLPQRRSGRRRSPRRARREGCRRRRPPGPPEGLRPPAAGLGRGRPRPP